MSSQTSPVDKELKKLVITLSRLQNGTLTDAEIQRKLRQMHAAFDERITSGSQPAQSRQKKAREILSKIRSQLGDDIYFLCILALQITPLSALQPRAFCDALSSWREAHPIPSDFTEMARGQMEEFLRERRIDDASATVLGKRRGSTLSPFEEHTSKRRKGCNENTPSNDEAGHTDMANNTVQTKSVKSHPEIDSLLKNPDETRLVVIEGHSGVGQNAESCVDHREVAAPSENPDDNVEIGTRHLQPPQPLLEDTTSAEQDLHRGIEPTLAGLPSFPIDAMDAVRGLTLPGCKVWLSLPITSTLELTPSAYVSFTIPYDTAFEIMKRNQQSCGTTSE